MQLPFRNLELTNIDFKILDDEWDNGIAVTGLPVLEKIWGDTIMILDERRAEMYGMNGTHTGNPTRYSAGGLASRLIADSINARKRQDILYTTIICSFIVLKHVMVKTPSRIHRGLTRSMMTTPKKFVLVRRDYTNSLNGRYERQTLWKLLLSRMRKLEVFRTQF